MRQRGGTHAALRHREWWRGASRSAEAEKHNRQAQHGVEGSAPHRAEAFVAIQHDDERETGHTPSLDQPVTAPESKKQYQQARHSGRCGSNQIPKRRQQRVGPAEPLVSTAMRQGEGREGKRQRATQPHTTRNKPKGGEQGKGTSRKKRQQDTTRKNSTTRTKASKATRKRLGRGNRPRESHQGNRHTCTYQNSERGARRLPSQWDKKRGRRDEGQHESWDVRQRASTTQ